MGDSNLGSLRALLLGAGLTLAFVVSGCATTQQAKIADTTYCPFMGAKLCSKLTVTETPGRFDVASGAPVANLRYVDSSANWKSYDKILIQPVMFWAGDDVKVSPKDQTALTNYFYAALEKQLGAKYQLVSEPAPGAMTLHVAIEDASTATPVLRTISMLVPQARALATLKYVATGTYPFVGSAQAEAKITDSETGVPLAAGVDRRVGGGSLANAAQWQLGDAEHAIDAWATQITTRLVSYTSGTAVPK